MSSQVPVHGQLFEWACERNPARADEYGVRFPHLEAWKAGEAHPTLKQLEAFAKATHTPIGYFFLSEPPHEAVPIPDFRTVARKQVSRPSADLLDMIYACQQRQEWYRDFARTSGEQPLSFVGSTKLSDEPVRVAAAIRHKLGFDVAARAAMPTWSEALRRFIAQADDAGILVMCSGIVGSNTHRRLAPDEFRGFALSDEIAPLVFINGADSKSAQMFTLAHELAHIWLGQTGVSDNEPTRTPAGDIERWCDSVAAELLVPMDVFQRHYDRKAELSGELAKLVRIFKVSTLVILRRMHDAGGLGRDRFWREYEAEVARLADAKAGSGGNFYLTTAARVSKRFARALIVSTREGRSSFTEAFRLLGVRKMESFRGLSASLGMPV